MNINLGYCCINLSLPGVSVNRSCVKRTFLQKGISHVSSLAVINISNLIKIINWNHDNDIFVYRMSSDMFPWMSEYELSDLPDFIEIQQLLQQAGSLALQYGQRLSFHPGPFNVLGSPNPDLVQKTVKELNQHAQIMDLMTLPQSRQYPINIHCNGVYGDKSKTLQRWCDNFLTLSESTQNRLVVENDDKGSMYSVVDLYHGIFKKIHVPITFDYHHHRFNSSDLSEEEAFKLAYSTWGEVKPLFHYSSCRRTFEDSQCKAQAHADYVYEKIKTYSHPIDIEVESKAKDLAILQYRKNQNTLLEEYQSF